MVFESANDMFIVDAGLMFPDDDMLGIDFIIPDYSYVCEKKDKLRGIIITHGHEDHTGALPFLLKQVGTRCPVYGTSLTLGLIKEKLNEYGIKDVQLKRVHAREMVDFGDFRVEFIKVTHSIAGGLGLGIMTPVGRVIHTGDFKFDLSPVDGEGIDFYKFAQYGEHGVLLMLSDSTNAEHEGFTLSERKVRVAFEGIFSKADGRIIIATFASNIHRIQQAIDVAVEFGKKVILCGRSIVSNANIATDLGYLKVPANTLYRIEQINTLNPRKVVIITTGSQGEPMSVLTRIACDTHKYIKIEQGDTVVVSAKVIPGNEKAVGRTIDRLFKRGANVVYEKVSDIHVSGHGSTEELKLMLNIVRPKYFVPIHGEYRHLVSHARLAEGVAIQKENIFIMQNGDVLGIDTGFVGVTNHVQAGRIFIDGKNSSDINNNAILKERKRLARGGFITVMVSINKETGGIIQGPEILYKGFIFDETSQDVINEAKTIIVDIINNGENRTYKDITQVELKVQSALKKFLRNKLDKRPLILPIIVEK
ncbi:MAG: ribonuclease J [Candidatus Magnetoovum sp. WYHC-5]|nr:ribonuclease J [Candidatus Magnetoovum sp. WYHC-5]